MLIGHEHGASQVMSRGRFYAEIKEGHLRKYGEHQKWTD